MWAKLGNGLGGTWESLDQRERFLVVYGLFVAAFAVYMAAAGPRLAERKRKEQRELADLIAERIGKYGRP